MPLIRKYVELFRLDDENLHFSQFFLAKLEGELVEDEVFVTTDIPSYFEKLGFKIVKNGPPELEEKICRVCKKKLRQNVVLMRYRRS